MPGIVGLITRLPCEEAEQELRRMVEALRHESFYMTGTWVEEVARGVCRVDRAKRFLLGRNAFAK